MDGKKLHLTVINIYILNGLHTMLKENSDQNKYCMFRQSYSHRSDYPSLSLECCNPVLFQTKY